MVPNRTIYKTLNEYCDLHKFAHRVRYHAACKVAYMLSVSVNLTITLFDLKEFRDSPELCPWRLKRLVEQDLEDV